MTRSDRFLQVGEMKVVSMAIQPRSSIGKLEGDISNIQRSTYLVSSNHRTEYAC